MRHHLYTSILTAAVFTALPVAAQVHASEAPPPKAATPPAGPADLGTPQPSSSPAAGTLAEPQVFRFEDMPARTAPNGSESRNITHGTLRTGETVNLHESAQPAGTPPVALHVIHHTEFICVQSGELTFDYEDAAGKPTSERAGPGSVIYVAAETKHRVRNTGADTARYTVIAIGGDAK
jgi:mannose-6-phosphate isomerase-like protein (cupin superfamily)